MGIYEGRGMDGRGIGRKGNGGGCKIKNEKLKIWGVLTTDGHGWTRIFDARKGRKGRRIVRGMIVRGMIVRGMIVRGMGGGRKRKAESGKHRRTPAGQAQNTDLPSPHMKVMRASIWILVLVVLVAGCKGDPESAASADEGMQKKLAGIWVCDVKSRKEIKGTNTINLAADGSYISIVSLPKREVGLRRLESSGKWRIEDGSLIISQTNANFAEVQGTNVWRLKIVRVEERELELEPGGDFGGINIPTNRTVYRREAR
jgi:hypothetical protein